MVVALLAAVRIRTTRRRLPLVAALALGCSGALTGCFLGPEQEERPESLSASLKSIQPEVYLTPEIPRPGSSVEMQVYAHNDGNTELTADLSLDVSTSDGNSVHLKPWNGLTFPPGEGWLLSSSFFMDGRQGSTPYSARVSIRDSADGTVYFDDAVLRFGDGGPALRLGDES